MRFPDPTSPKGMVKFALLGAFLIFIAWLSSLGLVVLLFGKPTTAGEFGDLFGAINALFSGLAFLGIIVAIILQRQELIEQRNEIRNSRIAQEHTAAALQQTLEDAKIRTQLESLNLVITSYSRLSASTRLSTTVVEKERHQEITRKLSDYEKRLLDLVDQTIQQRDI